MPLSLSPADLAPYIDHTILKANASPAQVETLCHEAREHGFASVCVNGIYSSLVKKNLSGSSVKTCVVVGFPLGAMSSASKAAETSEAVLAGADEIDMVIAIGKLKAGEEDYVEQDIRAVVKAAQGKIVKVIIEACYLDDPQKILACRLAEKAGAHFVKTSTGFGPSGAKLDDVLLMCQTVPHLQVKAAGGIRDSATALSFIQAGADRIGASASVSIIGKA